MELVYITDLKFVAARHSGSTPELPRNFIMNIEEKLEFTKQKLSEGWSQRKIARELEVDHSTVGYWIKKNFEVVGRQQTSLIRLNEVANRNKHQYSYILASYRRNSAARNGSAGM